MENKTKNILRESSSVVGEYGPWEPTDLSSHDHKFQRTIDSKILTRAITEPDGLVRVENTDKILAILKGLGYNNSAKFTR